MQFVSYYLFIGIIYPLSLLPLNYLYTISDVLCFLLNSIIGYRKKVIINNLKKSFPNYSEKKIAFITKKYYSHLADLIIENIKLVSIRKVEVLKRCKVKNLEILTEYFENKQSVIGIVGHYGNWELGGFSLALNSPHKVDAIYKPLQNGYFDTFFIKLRSRFGTRLAPMDKVVRSMMGKKDELTLTILIADQTPSNTQQCHWMKFLNQDTPVFLGAEKIAKKTNQPVIFCKMNKIKRGYYEVEFIKIDDQPKLSSPYFITEKHTLVLEEIINKNPDYWLWSHKRWKHKRKIPANYAA